MGIKREKNEGNKQETESRTSSDAPCPLKVEKSERMSEVLQSQTVQKHEAGLEHGWLQRDSTDAARATTE